MRIGIAVWSSAIEKEGQREYCIALVDCLVNTAPNASFILFTDEATLFNHQGITQMQVPIVNSYFGLRRWYSKGLPDLLVKEKVDHLISINSGHVNTAIPQLSLITDVKAPLLACKSWLSFLYKKFVSKRLQKAQHIATVSKPQQQEVEKIFGVKADQLFAAGYAVPATYQPADWQQRETFLQNQTGGREYFLYTGIFNENQFLSVLKAFSLFKKRQKSNMQLLAVGRFSTTKLLQEKLATYKYRSDVRLLNDMSIDLLPPFFTCAYAVLFTRENATVAYPVAAAMQCAVPVIGYENNDATAEVAGQAALYAQATPENLAEQMKLIYKDELLRQNLIAYTDQLARLIDGRLAAERILNRLTNNASIK